MILFKKYKMANKENPKKETEIPIFRTLPINICSSNKSENIKGIHTVIFKLIQIILLI